VSTSALELVERIELTQAVADRLGLASRDLLLRRAWPRSRTHLVLEFISGAGELSPGQWFADPSLASAMLERTCAREPAAPCAALERLGVFIQRDGWDVALPGIRVALQRPEAALVSHRPGRRAVVRVDAPTQTSFIKIVEPARIDRLITTLRTAATAEGDDLRVPHITAIDEPHGCLEMTSIPGDPLSSIHEGESFSRALEAAGAALRLLHNARPPESWTARCHGPEAEFESLSRWLDFATTFAPDVAKRARPLIESLRASMPEAGLETMIHRDFHEGQVIVTEGRAGIIDFETLALGDSALDIGNMIAHLEWRSLTTRDVKSRTVQWTASLLSGYAGQPSDSLPGFTTVASIDWYRRMSHVRLLCVHAFRPGSLAALRRALDDLPFR
jgi:aminoglycoside phosphotransferase (APT) family kinase protein